MNRPTNNFPGFSSLQSLYALNQAPNLEQFHMDSRLRIDPVNKDANNQINKSHLAAQCAPVKPVRSFAVPIAKQSIITPKITAGPSVPLPNKVAVTNPSSEDNKKTTNSTTADCTTQDQKEGK